ncbi:RNA polymerase sigma factor [Clostridioides sp. ES-S-0006-03]|uniref:RNA polymerase sigma factor n=1 Tax=Clostridioides sp. ES-S-0006-03 TaxID=2770775 RepID=UPI001D0C97F9|nr:RNA polymerase sigma factor [Clostridioides sp. ES-S-0006-03]
MSESTQNNVKKDEIENLIDRAILGDKKSLEILLLDVQDLVFNLSLRMLGTVQDAEDASQEIMIRVITHISTFRKESSFSTWVFRIAYNHLQNYKKSMFSKQHLSFEYYGADIKNGKSKDIPDLSQNVETSIIEEELKYSCTNVMLQCLDVESRCIFILGTMFKLNSKVAADILDISSEAYRQRLSRIRKKMASFLDEYCGLSGKGVCQCKKRINYAIVNHRINPKNLEYSSLEKDDDNTIFKFKSAMEEAENFSTVFSRLPSYYSSEKLKKFLIDFLQSDCYSIIKNL